MPEPQILIDHLTSSRRGQRQVFRVTDTVRFGRHPASDVCFDAHRDLDASSRHAELEPGERGHLLRDVGSSNGTFVDGARVVEVELGRDQPVVIQFGAAGPSVRVYIGDPDSMPPLPARAATRMPLAGHSRAVWVAVAVAIVGLGLWVALV